MLKHKPTGWTTRLPGRHPSRQPHVPTIAILLLIPLITSGCSVKRMAMNSVANALSGGEGGSNVYLTDDDPILVGQALPFSLKLMETILQETPKHEGLLVAAATGFVSYAEMWVLRPARYMEATDLHGFRRGRERAKKLFLRARDYAGRALEIRHPGIVPRLLMAPDSVMREFEAEDIPAMYWFAAAHGRAIWTDLSDAFLVVEAPAVTALLDRALELDEDWNRGALHELYMGIPAQLGGSHEKTLEHFAKAMEENGGMSIGPLVSLAESVHQPRQDREAFVQILNEALAFDPNDYPETRLTNILAQEHAAWLLSRTDELFWMEPGGRASEPASKRKGISWLPVF
ncbi:MAG: TRAP transporter TatT component family protein [Longimicrobiales bacterium]|nr:TRAP transporter TatT component family protein [Longimicrobiales bacterium]